MTWYGIVTLFMLVGSGCAAIGVLTGLEVKRYKAVIEREEAAIEAFHELIDMLMISKLTITFDRYTPEEVPSDD